MYTFTPPRITHSMFNFQQLCFWC